MLAFPHCEVSSSLRSNGCICEELAGDALVGKRVVFALESATTMRNSKTFITGNACFKMNCLNELR